jgi:hypothetical protein
MTKIPGLPGLDIPIKFRIMLRTTFTLFAVIGLAVYMDRNFARKEATSSEVLIPGIHSFAPIVYSESAPASTPDLNLTGGHFAAPEPPSSLENFAKFKAWQARRNSESDGAEMWQGYAEAMEHQRLSRSKTPSHSW